MQRNFLEVRVSIIFTSLFLSYYPLFLYFYFTLIITLTRNKKKTMMSPLFFYNKNDVTSILLRFRGKLSRTGVIPHTWVKLENITNNLCFIFKFT